MTHDDSKTRLESFPKENGQQLFSPIPPLLTIYLQAPLRTFRNWLKKTFWTTSVFAPIGTWRSMGP